VIDQAKCRPAGPLCRGATQGVHSEAPAEEDGGLVATASGPPRTSSRLNRSLPNTAGEAVDRHATQSPDPRTVAVIPAGARLSHPPQPTLYWSKPLSTIDIVRSTLGQVLQLGGRQDSLLPDSPLLGAVPELDSMAVVSLIAALEDQFGIMIDDDEIDGATFATLGSLSAFCEQKQRA
jgi:acyl carrier protein